tara:strand:- start:1265 stop:1663 length:399 start_codon:yes stop_codon:yes gene_type:complete
MDEAFHTAWKLIKSRARGNGREITSVVPSEEMDDQTWEDWAWEDLHEPTGQFHGEEEPEEEEEMGHEEAAVQHMLDSGMTPAEIAAYQLRMDSILPAVQGSGKPPEERPEPEDVPEERSITNEELARLLGLD